MLKKYVRIAIDKAHRDKYQTLNIIYINRQNILDNLKVFSNLNPGFKTMAVLKANAYGHGLTQATKILNEADIDFIAVDGYFEANRISFITKHKILVMGYILPGNTRLLDNKKCSYVVQDIESLKALGSDKRHFKVHIELNTGMNRLGLRNDEVAEYLNVLKSFNNLQLEGIMSHLADADNPDNSYTDMQVRKFDEAVKQILDHDFKPKYIHIAQSAGSLKVKSKYANTMRIGIGLYGINPLDKKDKEYEKLISLKPVLELKSKIIKVFEVGPNEKISYNGVYKTKQPAKVAVLPLGYYEWIPRELSNKGVFTSGLYKLPVCGRVCMNHTMVDVTGTNLNVGDEVTVISSKGSDPNSIESICAKYDLFSSQLLTRLSESIRRIVI